VRISALNVPLVQVLAALAVAAVIWLASNLSAQDRLSPGTFVAFVAAMAMLFEPIRRLTNINDVIQRGLAGAQSLFDLLDTPPEPASSSAAQLPRARGHVRFEGVSFRYPGQEAWAVQDFSLELRPGETLALVGAPGSGKSTIAALIARFYDVTAGTITIDGVDIRDITLASLRDHVGLVQQEAFLFDAPIGHNLAYADPWADEGRIIEAASVAQLHDHVAALPEQYETRVGERGVSLSGGQRQRTSIARGILPGPNLIIFDDSTAAIDTVTEEKVRAGLAKHNHERATIIIAHRLSSVLHADEIVVLDGGVVVERGHHASLLRQGGIYARLYELQSRQARDGGTANSDAGQTVSA